MEALSVIGEVLGIVRSLLGGWSHEEVDYYFELALQTSDFTLAVRTNDRVAARTIANGVADYMRELRARDRQQLARPPHLLE